MRKATVLMTVGLVLITSSVLLLSKPKKSNARQNKNKPSQDARTQKTPEISIEQPKPTFNSLRVIGDSQVARTLGDAANEVFNSIEVSSLGKSGYTVEKFLSDNEALNDAISKSADVFYIQLGDNGVSSNTENIRLLVRAIQRQNPNSKIIWGGPVKAVAPSIQSYYVSTTDKRSPRYLPTYNRTRQEWSRRLQEALEGIPNVYFLDTYKLQETQPRTSAFSDARKGDGVHLTKDSAQELMRLLEKVIQNTLYSKS